MRKRIWGLLMVMITLTAFAPWVHAAMVIDNVQCGENLFCTLDDEGTLTITGTGEMYETWGAYGRPWDDEREQIKSVVIENGLTEIGHSAFSGCSNLTSISIPNSVTSAVIGFVENCTSLEEIYIPASITYLDTWWCVSGKYKCR